MTAFNGAVYWVTDVMSAAHNAKFGTLGEANTTDLFRTRTMRRKGWKIVDSVPFDRQFGDVDHVACGPAGVLAIETKWTNVPWKFTDGNLVTPGDPLKQARTGARKGRHLLASQNIATDVLPVLIVWGPGSLPSDFVAQMIDGRSRRQRSECSGVHQRREESFCAPHPVYVSFAMVNTSPTIAI